MQDPVTMTWHREFKQFKPLPSCHSTENFPCLLQSSGQLYEYYLWRNFQLFLCKFWKTGIVSLKRIKITFIHVINEEISCHFGIVKWFYQFANLGAVITLEIVVYTSFTFSMSLVDIALLYLPLLHSSNFVKQRNQLKSNPKD